MFNILLAEEKIGYVFKDKNLLIQCFTHSSYSNEHKNYKNNERLEFFGDSILGFIVTEYLYNEKTQVDEGKLTELKQKIVSKKPLSKATVDNEFDKLLLLGQGQQNYLQKSQNLAENLFEALVGGIYIDGGLQQAKKFVYDKLLSDVDFDLKSIDYKSEFQEYVQKYHLGDISYETIETVGPSHNPTFTVQLSLSGKVLTKAQGQSKQKAQQKCAENALKSIKTKGNQK